MPGTNAINTPTAAVNSATGPGVAPSTRAPASPSGSADSFGAAPPASTSTSRSPVTAPVVPTRIIVNSASAPRVTFPDAVLVPNSHEGNPNEFKLTYTTSEGQKTTFFLTLEPAPTGSLANLTETLCKITHALETNFHMFESARLTLSAGNQQQLKGYVRHRASADAGSDVIQTELDIHTHQDIISQLAPLIEELRQLLEKHGVVHVGINRREVN